MSIHGSISDKVGAADEFDVKISPGSADPGLGDWLTTERLLWSLLLLLAAFLRLWNLGGLPLQAGEAANALASWQLLQGQASSVSQGPFLVYGNFLVYLMLGANDASARLIPALAGIALVGLPYLLRAQLGRSGALCSALLLTVSPMPLYLSRLVDAQSLAALLGLGMVVAVLNFFAQQSRHWLYACALTLGLLPLLGREGYTMLLVLVGAVVGLIVWRRDEFEARLSEMRPQMRAALAVAAATLVLGVTGMLVHWHGVQEGLVDGLGSWLLSLGGNGSPRHLSLQILLVYQPLLLLFCLVGAVSVLRARDRLGLFLIWWATAALSISAFSGERLGMSLGLAIVPMALLAGPAIVRLLKDISRIVPVLSVAVYLAITSSLLILFWLATLFFSLPGQTLPAMVPFGPLNLPLRLLGDLGVSILMLLLVGGVIGLGLWLDNRALGHLMAVLALLVLGAVTLHASALLNFAGYASAAELPVSNRTSVDVRSLTTTVGDTVDALAVGNRPRTVRVAVPNEPVLGWYLREQVVSYGERPMPGEGLIIAPFGSDPPPGKFAAQRFRLRGAWVDNPSDLRSFWRWLTLREPPRELIFEDLVLYVRMM